MTPVRRVVAPLRDFLHTEVAGGILLLVATASALVWANSPWSDSYEDLWSTTLAVGPASSVSTRTCSTG